jgi:regulator of cell morphogenesis and NO signaling
MEHEHESAGEALSEMRRLSGDYTAPADACNTFRGLYHGLEELEADLHRHIHLENNILHPRAKELERQAVEA